jgi:regulatory protein
MRSCELRAASRELMTDAYLSALRILKFRFNSEAELRRKLRAKKFEKPDIDAAVEQLRKEKWIDDERFAESFARAKASKKLGANRIVRELEAAGVTEEIAKRAVAGNVDKDREREHLVKLYERRAQMLVRKHGEEYLATREGRAKLTSFLLSKGYDSSDVSLVLREKAKNAERRTQKLE